MNNEDFEETKEYAIGAVKFSCTVRYTTALFGAYRWQVTDTSTGEFRGGFASSTEQAWTRCKFSRYEMHESIYS